MASLPNIVITGIGQVTPIGSDPSSVVSALRKGITGIRPVVLDDILPILMGRISEADFPRDNSDVTVKVAGFAARQAWEQSNLELKNLDPQRVMTIIGSSKGRLSNLLTTSVPGQRHFDVQNFPGNTLGLAVAAEMGFEGAVLNYPAACATGVHCIIRAIMALQMDEADVVMAGSGEASGKALLMASFSNMGALTRDAIRPFDTRRKGFNPGEGAAVFTLEREADARARGAEIFAVIKGWDQRSDAYHMTSAEPSGKVVSYSINRTLQIAGWEPGQIQYINAHGTGTPLNDMVEGRAIVGSFGKESPLVSSLKPNIGHLLGASSAVELALSILSLRDGFVPPTLGLEQPDPEIPLHFVPTGGIQEKVNKFMKLSLGFGGHIGVMAVELPEG